jgi:GNAT superfamily N-acetyltransferase
MSGNASADLTLLPIRLAQAADTDAVRALVIDAYGHYVARIGKLPAPLHDDYARRIAADQAWVWEEDGRIVGLLVLENKPAHLLLDNVAVAPAAQGRGIGRALIAFAEREARRRGFAEIHLYTHALMVENRALYGRLGFAEIRRLQEDGYDRVYMAKPLRGEHQPASSRGREPEPDAL